MIKWIYQNYFLEGKEILFIISIFIILMMIIITFFLVRFVLRGNKNVYK